MTSLRKQKEINGYYIRIEEKYSVDGLNTIEVNTCKNSVMLFRSVYDNMEKAKQAFYYQVRKYK